MPDRGRLETGLRADVVRVHLHGTLADRAAGLAGGGAGDLMAARVAIYYAPLPDDPLTAAEFGLAGARPVDQCAGAAA